MTTVQLPKKHDWQDLGPDHGKLRHRALRAGLRPDGGQRLPSGPALVHRGSRPTWAKIDHVLHEFSHVAGMTEDTLDVLTNLRKVVFKLHGERSRLIRLRAEGPRVVKARDFETEDDIEILNPEQPLATLDRDGSLTWKSTWRRAEARCRPTSGSRDPAGQCPGHGRRLLAGDHA